MSACGNAPGISVTTTYLFSFASIVHDSIIASSDTLCELASSFVLNSLCSQPSAQLRAFNVPCHFSFNNIQYFIVPSRFSFNNIIYVVIMKSMWFIAIMPTASVTSPYLSIISLGMLLHVVHTWMVGRLVVFPFRDPRLGLKMSSPHIISSLVMLQLGMILPSTYLMRSSVLGLPMVFCVRD